MGNYAQESEECLTDVNGYTLIMKAAICNATQALAILLSQDGAPINAQHGKVSASDVTVFVYVLTKPCRCFRFRFRDAFDRD